jgi:hypothetical protein
MNEPYHWSNDPYWTEALDKFFKLRDKKGKTSFELDLAAISEGAYDENSPAYKLMDAMASVKEQEGMEGFRGAPRIMLALLVRLEEISKANKKRR